MGRYLVHRSDTTAHSIRQALERVGAVVWPVGEPVDFLVLYRRKLYGLEVKSSPRAQLRRAQREFFAAGAPGGRVENETQALQAIGAIK